MEVYHSSVSPTVTHEDSLRAFFAQYAATAYVRTTNRDLAAQIGCAPSCMPNIIVRLERSGDIQRVSVDRRGSIFQVLRGGGAPLGLTGGTFRYRPTPPARTTPHSSICILLREWCAVERTIRVTNRIIAEAACCAVGAVSPVLQSLEADGVIGRAITARYTDITLLRSLEVLR